MVSFADQPYPLRRKYLIYGGTGNLLFYAMLIFLIAESQNNALHTEYLDGLTNKVQNFYASLYLHFLSPRHIGIDQVIELDQGDRNLFRIEVKGLTVADKTIEKLRFFDLKGHILYDLQNPSGEGGIYEDVQKEAFVASRAGKMHFELEKKNSRNDMETYLPIENSQGQILGIMEVYEDVSRFEQHVMTSLIQGLAWPSLVYLLFNLTLYTIVFRADKIICSQTIRLLTIRKNIEKYIFTSTAQAIDEAFVKNQAWLPGKKQSFRLFLARYS